MNRWKDTGTILIIIGVLHAVFAIVVFRCQVCYSNYQAAATQTFWRVIFCCLGLLPLFSSHLAERGFLSRMDCT